ncbi:MAG TPA: hypothetical protein PKE59_00035 [Novosphingobium sp.]|nr:hypothetical protein [Novosphingobium sp.]
MDHMNEDRLQSISALMDDAQRCILQAALKGRVSHGHKERIEQMLKQAFETAGRLQPETKSE